MSPRNKINLHHRLGEKLTYFVNFQFLF